MLGSAAPGFIVLSLELGDMGLARELDGFLVIGVAWARHLWTGIS